ncbi:MAG: cbb3-type cytochrome oxidase assembly protein CcoS [Fluviibacter sp.]
MESLYLLIPVSIILVFVIAGLFWWSVRSGQFDDLEGPAHRILMDGEPKRRSGVKDDASVAKKTMPD